MRNIIFGILALGIIGFYLYTNPSSDNDWLYGKWNLQKEAKKTIITNMAFREDGTMTLGNNKGVVYKDCTYEFFTRRDIDFTCIINGKQGTFPLKVNLDNTVITDSSKNTFTRI